MVAVPKTQKDVSSGENYKVHPEFKAPDAEITVLSSDNELFRIHTLNVRFGATSFPLPSESTEEGFEDVNSIQGVDVKSPFSSKVLVTLFKYLYPTPPHPDLADLCFDDLKEVAYAAETYGVSAAVTVAKIRMLAPEVADKHPVALLPYAVSYLDNDQINKIALQSLSTKVEEALKELGLLEFRAWILHRELWSRAHPPTTAYTTQYHALKHKAPVEELKYTNCLDRLKKGEFRDEDKDHSRQTKL